MSNGLTAKADDNHAIDIGIACKSGQHLLRHIRVGLHIGAARIEHDVHRAANLAGDNARTLAAAHAGRKNQDMIANARTAFGSSVSPELHLFSSLHQFTVVVARNAEDVVLIDPATLRNGMTDLANHLTILDRFVTFAKIHKRNLMAVGDVFHCGHGLNPRF